MDIDELHKNNSSIFDTNENDLQNLNTLDFIDDPVINQYFKVQEYSLYYESLKRVGPRREISLELLSVIEPFFKFAINKNAYLKIDFIIKNYSVPKSVFPSHDINIEAKNLNKKGFKYLDIKQELTIPYLKKWGVIPNNWKKSSLIK